jgi:ribulose-phosphate 3-epimerase
MIKVAPSTHPCNEKKLLEYALLLQKSGADMLHCDVMDGSFVKNVSLSYEKVRELSFGCLLPIDVHLMVERPIEEINRYLQAKVNYITVHKEAFESKEELVSGLNLIKSHQVLAGLSIKPKTPVSEITPYLDQVHLVLVMSVEPGYSGQEFIESTLAKVEELNKIRQEKGFHFKIQVDGGINHTNIHKVAQAGADIVVVGSAMFNAPNKKVYIDRLKQQAHAN